MNPSGRMIRMQSYEFRERMSTKKAAAIRWLLNPKNAEKQLQQSILQNSLTNLPETAVIVYTEPDDVSQVFCKINPSSSAAWDISYSEYPGDTVIRLDTEDADMSEYIINGMSITAAEKEDLVSLWWHDGDTIFIFQGQNMTLPSALEYVRRIVPADEPGKTERED